MFTMEQVQEKKMININLLECLVNWLKQHPQQEAIISKMEKKYGPKLKYSSPQLILEKALKKLKRTTAYEKYSCQSEQASNERWCFNEYVIFVWITVYMCCREDIDLQEMKNIHFDKVNAIFEGKSQQFIKYELLSLIACFSREYREWSQEELTLLASLKRKKKDRSEWRTISFSFFCLSKGKYFRSIAQCRQRWMNYLNPRLQKRNWTAEEDLILFTLVEELGCQWSRISKKFNGSRTEHMIKNRYNHYKAIWSKHKKLRGNFIRIIPKIKQNLQEQIQGIRKQEQSEQKKIKNHPKTRLYRKRITSTKKKENSNIKISFDMEKDGNQQIINQTEIDLATSNLQSERNISEVSKSHSLTEDKPVEELLISIKNSFSLSFQDHQCQQISLKDIYADAASALGCPYYESIRLDDPLLQFLTEKQTFKWIE